MDTIRELFSNAAFWVFLGTAVTAFFGYKGIIARYPKKIPDPKKASTFEELMAIVELLQGELTKKDKRYSDDINYVLQRIKELRDENADLRENLAAALRSNATLKEEVANLKDLIKVHEKRLNKDHVGENGQ